MERLRSNGQPQPDNPACEQCQSQSAQSYGQALVQQRSYGLVQRQRISQVATHQRAKIVSIKAGNIRLREMLLADGLDALRREIAAQLSLIGRETRRGAQEERAQETCHQHDGQETQDPQEEQSGHQLTNFGGITGPWNPVNCDMGLMLLARCFCRYMRRSASAKSFSVSVPSSGNMAQPTLSDNQSSPQVSRPAALANSPRQTPRASAAEALNPGATTTNSSPPMRAM